MSLCLAHTQGPEAKTNNGEVSGKCLTIFYDNIRLVQTLMTRVYIKFSRKERARICDNYNVRDNVLWADKTTVLSARPRSTRQWPNF